MKKLFVAILSSSLILINPATQANDGRTKKDVYTDPSYQNNVAKVRSELQARGYQINNVEAGEHDGKKTLEVTALKNGQKWSVRLDYPSLKLIGEKRDD